MTLRAWLPTSRSLSFMLKLQLLNSVLFRKQREDHAKKTLVAVIYRVDLLKDAIAALQHVGGILQTLPL